MIMILLICNNFFYFSVRAINITIRELEKLQCAQLLSLRT